MFKGVHKKLLRVDLSRGKTTTENIDEELFHLFIGGSGLATKYLFDEVPPDTDPLGEDNKLIFAAGPFQGSWIPGSGKWVAVSKSPLTGTFSVSAAGADWGVKLKKTGYDLIIVEGSSLEPVLLSVTDEEAKISPATNLWGEDAISTVDLVQDKLEDERASAVTIGPAGENLVGCACITADKHSFAGRTGLGAVMGSKNLKAIAVNGREKIPIDRPKELQGLSKEFSKFLYENTRETNRAHGTPGGVANSESNGDLPIRNWSQATWPDGAERISAPRYTEKLNAQPWPCLSCPIGCHRKIETEYKGETIKGAGAEYETLGMIGSNCLVDDLDGISKANDLCNRLGLDTIDIGAYSAFTMEGYEKGLITEDQLGDLRPAWGNVDFVIDFIRQVSNNEGYGSHFNKGFASAIADLGERAAELAVHVKNLAFPAHDPRTFFSLAINYATSTRGACHLRGYPHVGELGAVAFPEVGVDGPPERFSMEGQAKFTSLFQDLAALEDSLVLCVFQNISGLTLDDMRKLINPLAGTDYTAEELLRVGERIVNLQRLINVNDGIDRSTDRLPPKMFQPGKTGKRKGKIPEPFEKTLLEYYSYRGWNSNGIPTDDTLRKLKLVPGNE